MRSLNRGLSKNEEPETKTPTGNTYTSPDIYRRPLLRRSRILGSATGLFVMLPGVAAAQDYSEPIPAGEGQTPAPAQTAPAPEAQPIFLSPEETASLSPAGKLFYDMLVVRAQNGDPEIIKRTLENHQGFSSFSQFAENYLHSVKPQDIKKVLVKRINKKKIKISITNSDSEAALVTSSNRYVHSSDDGSYIPEKNIDQFDSDHLLTNPRSLRVFKIKKFGDWALRGKWRPISKRVNVEEWNETRVNSLMPGQTVRDPFSDFSSNLSHVSQSQIELSSRLTPRDIKLGLVAIEVTQQWGQRNIQDGQRQGYERVLYRLPRKREGQAGNRITPYIRSQSWEQIKYKYSTKPVEVRRNSSESAQLTQVRRSTSRNKNK